MREAHRIRAARFPGGIVTYVPDTNPNYTNVCATQCRFCAFSKAPGEPGAYTLSPEELADRVGCSYDRGATTVLFQGGHNPDLGPEDWVAYIRAVRGRCPHIHIHPFSPAEVHFMAENRGISVREILEALYAEGIRTLPGGGAEILSPRVRRMISPDKATTRQWLSVCETAHRIGFRTTATMVFGHLETDEEIVDHLFRLRDLQDRTGGFSSFVAWSFKPGNSPLTDRVPAIAHPLRYIRILALARIVLDNFPHVQSSWFSENLAAGQLGLLGGADDFGGILMEEHVLKETGYDRSATLDNVLNAIRRTGFTPARRDSFYRIRDVHGPETTADEVVSAILRERRTMS
jgi:cyclic dehypoxanthinyl futalosine synthase